MDRDDWLIIRKAGETATGAQDSKAVYLFLQCWSAMKNLHWRGLFVRRVGSFGKIIAGSVCTSELQQAQQSQISKKLWVI